MPRFMASPTCRQEIRVTHVTNAQNNQRLQHAKATAESMQLCRWETYHCVGHIRQAQEPAATADKVGSGAEYA